MGQGALAVGGGDDAERRTFQRDLAIPRRFLDFYVGSPRNPRACVQIRRTKNVPFRDSPTCEMGGGMASRLGAIGVALAFLASVGACGSGGAVQTRIGNRGEEPWQARSQS